MTRLEICNLFDTTNTIASDIFEGKKYPFQVLPEIKDFIVECSEEQRLKRRTINTLNIDADVDGDIDGEL